MARALQRLARALGRLLLLVLVLSVVLPLARVAAECRVFSGESPEQATAQALPAEVQAAREGVVDYERAEEQSFLTFPEWYIVYSAEEYAAFIEENPPSQFPYFRAIGQYWQSYYEICEATRDEYPFNSTYHMTLMVIGPSFTIENLLRGIYENTVGRLTEWSSSSDLTEEDAYARRVAEEYGAFMHTIPWFEFPFAEKLRGLWQETELWGPNPIRKWERKVALSVEYGLKAVYGWLIKQGSKSAYGPEAPAVYAWGEGFSERLLRQEPEVRVVKRVPPRGAIVALPRYEPFTQVVPGLLRRGARFIDIAGNDEIMISAIAPSDWERTLEEGTVLFSLPILTQPERQRVVIKVPVRALHRVLAALEEQSIELEHLYDY